MTSSDTDCEEFCQRCSRNFHESDLTPVTTVVNGVEQKEWVCPSCEPKTREDEKPRSVETDTDGGESG